MCGLVGAAGGDFDYKLKDGIKDMLVLGSIRGPDSTGLASIDITRNEVNIIKAVGNPYDLFDQKKFDSVCTMYNKNVFIGHNRKATRGDITKSNAHPFWHGEIVGVHNGTLHTHRVPTAEEDFGTDSEGLISSISKVGIQKTIESVAGAWALVWWDNTEQTLNFLRNNERTLWYAFSEDMNKIFWASEWWMINNSMNRDGREVKFAANKNGNHFFMFPPDRWFRFKIPTTKTGEIDQLDPITVKGNVKPQNGFFDRYRHRVPWEWEDYLDDDPIVYLPSNKGKEQNPPPQENTKTPAESHSSSGVTTDSKTSDKPIQSPPQCMDSSAQDNKRNTSERLTPLLLDNGKVKWLDEEITVTEFRKRTVSGCNWCRKSVTARTLAKVLSDTTFLCSTCWPSSRAIDAEVIPSWVNAQ